MFKFSYKLSPDGIYRPPNSVIHRDDEYDETGIETLWDMQDRHFWYRGRHRFLLKAVDKYMSESNRLMRAIDLGGGAGGWVRYMIERRGKYFEKIALADSSEVALTLAGKILPPEVDRYKIDLMNLGWDEEWDLVFMLDVIEHIPDDIRAISHAVAALKSGGLLFVTAPAFQEFWSYNDEFASHLRRYTRSDFEKIANQTELRLLDSRYFMFLLSPLYILSRYKPWYKKLTREQKRRAVQSHHRVPAAALNAALEIVFAAETPLGHWVPFPWGTSVLGIFQKI